LVREKLQQVAESVIRKSRGGCNRPREGESGNCGGEKKRESTPNSCKRKIE